MLPQGVYLASCLAPFEESLSRPDITDIYVNRPGEFWLETSQGSVERYDCAEMCELTLARFARQVAALTSQGINREHPLLAATLPDGSRIQVVAPPATRGPYAIAIRRHRQTPTALRDFQSAGCFAATGTRTNKARADDELRGLLDRRKFVEALSLAVRSRRNIVVSGGTSTGKTTFLNALLHEIPNVERLVIIEDTPELAIKQPNSVGLLAVRGQLGEARVTTNDLMSASLRMRPDRIILGELRGPEAFAFLRAVNSGHPGSMTTIHADSPAQAIEQLAMLVMHEGTTLNRADVGHYVRQSIDLFVQLNRNGGKRIVESIVMGTELARNSTEASSR
jgi:type IV secretion system protein VirB11